MLRAAKSLPGSLDFAARSLHAKCLTGVKKALMHLEKLRFGRFGRGAGEAAVEPAQKPFREHHATALTLRSGGVRSALG